MTRPYESDRNNNTIADKYSQEAADGLREILQADSRMLRGQSGLVETLGREINGYARVANGTWNSLFPPRSSEAENSSYGLHPLHITDEQESQRQDMDPDGNMGPGDESDPEGGRIRQEKKEKASAQENQQDDNDVEGGKIRQAKEKAAAQENQQDDDDVVGGKIRQAKKEKASAQESQ